MDLPRDVGAPRADETSVRLRAARAGDRESLAWAVERFHPFLKAQVRRRLGGSARPEDVEDVAQEAWAVMLRRLRDLRSGGGGLGAAFGRFLAVTAVQICNNRLRSAIRRGRFEHLAPRGADEEATGSVVGAPAADPTADDTGVVTRAARRETTSAIGRALEALGEDRRDVLVLRLFEDKSNVDIATELGIPPNTVAVRYRRALESLRAGLARELYRDVRTLRRAATEEGAER